MRIAGNVLVIDDFADTAEVLRAVFEPRGVRVDRLSCRPSAFIVDEVQDAPTVVVIDSDSWKPSNPCAVRWPGSPRVVLGRGYAETRATAGHAPTTEFLSKPFQYSELVGAIEQLMRVD
ncbi:MAG: hypothetical protein HY000_17830 [Planctomycetes bacterium]|nr:hypothetical protein [Planctomycetota bacterium]